MCTRLSVAGCVRCNKAGGIFTRGTAALPRAGLVVALVCADCHLGHSGCRSAWRPPGGGLLGLLLAGCSQWLAGCWLARWLLPGRPPARAAMPCSSQPSSQQLLEIQLYSNSTCTVLAASAAVLNFYLAPTAVLDLDVDLATRVGSY